MDVVEEVVGADIFPAHGAVVAVLVAVAEPQGELLEPAAGEAVHGLQRHGVGRLGVEGARALRRLGVGAGVAEVQRPVAGEVAGERGLDAVVGAFPLGDVEAGRGIEAGGVALLDAEARQREPEGPGQAQAEAGLGLVGLPGGGQFLGTARHVAEVGGFGTREVAEEHQIFDGHEGEAHARAPGVAMVVEIALVQVVAQTGEEAQQAPLGMVLDEDAVARQRGVGEGGLGRARVGIEGYLRPDAALMVAAVGGIGLDDRGLAHGTGLVAGGGAAVEIIDETAVVGPVEVVGGQARQSRLAGIWRGSDMGVFHP